MANQERTAGGQVVAIPTCPGLENCTLQYVQFDLYFQNISGIQFDMTIPKLNGRSLQNQDFLMDNLQLGWANNSCEAGLLRLSARK